MAKLTGRPCTGSRYFDRRGHVVVRVSISGSTVRVSIALRRPPGPLADALQTLVVDYCNTLIASGDVTIPDLRPALEAVLKRLPEKLEVAKLAGFWEELVSSKIAVKALVPAPELTFEQIATLWLSGELQRKHPGLKMRSRKTLQDAKHKLKTYAFPVIGPMPVNYVGIPELKRVIEYARGTGRLGEGSLELLWDIAKRVLSLAHYPLNLIPKLPNDELDRPKATRRKPATLEPSDDEQLLACRTISLHDRLWWGMLFREGTRSQELLALKWSALSNSGILTVWHSKTGEFSKWRLEPGTVRALQLYRKLCGNPGPDEPIFRPTRRTHLAGMLRADLEIAGIRERRPELWIDDDKHKQICAHEGRALFVTISLAGGKSDEYIRQRTMHRTNRMQEKYKRDVNLFIENGWVTLKPLDKAIPELNGRCKKIPDAPKRRCPVQRTPEQRARRRAHQRAWLARRKQALLASSASTPVADVGIALKQAV